MGEENKGSQLKQNILQVKMSLILALQKSLVILIILVVWEILPRVGVLDPVFIPPPSGALTALGNLISSGELVGLVVVSVKRAFLGYVLALFTAIPLGFLVGWFKGFEKYIDPLLQALRQVNVLTLIPMFILLFGIGETSKIAIISFASFWSLFLNTVSGVKNVDPLLIKCARSMNFSNGRIFRKVVLPAAIPTIFIGIRYAASVALLLLVAAEMLGGNTGLGYAINNWQLLFEANKMWAGIITMTIIGLIVNYIFVSLEKRLTHWKEDFSG